MLTGDNIIRDKISNEGTSDGGYRPTVNIIGLWMQQEIRRNFAAEGRDYTFPQLAELAAKEKPLQSFIRPDDFMQPGDYPTKIREYCKQTGQPVPQTDGALVRCILESLALKYKQTYLSLKPYITWEEKLYIVGGGVQNELLNQYTANALGIPVITGASEQPLAMSWHSLRHLTVMTRHSKNVIYWLRRLTRKRTCHRSRKLGRKHMANLNN